VIGAPWLDGHELANALNRLGLPGVHFRPTEFTPTTSKHEGLPCRGVQVHVTDRAIFRPVFTGLNIIAECRGQAPDRFEFLPSGREGHPPHFDLLMGNPHIRKGLARDVPVVKLAAEWEATAAEFEKKRALHLLYQA
jgi:uncharacterized protein YbbC (DUF1343 family)